MNWIEFQEELESCRDCVLCETRKNVVFGEGPQDASILVIGEGPGAMEDESGRPFVGRSGNLLTDLMEESGVPREKLFITNMVKCRPPENRNPKRDEIAACHKWLEVLLTILKPNVLVGVGNVPTQNLLGTKKGITSMRGVYHDVKIDGRDYLFLPVFHPAYLLRNRSRDEGKPLDLTLKDLASLKQWL